MRNWVCSPQLRSWCDRIFTIPVTMTTTYRIFSYRANRTKGNSVSFHIRHLPLNVFNVRWKQTSWKLLLTTVHTIELLFQSHPIPFSIICHFLSHLPLMNCYTLISCYQFWFSCYQFWLLLPFLYLPFMSHQYCCSSFCSFVYYPCLVLVPSTKSTVLTSVSMRYTNHTCIIILSLEPLIIIFQSRLNGCARLQRHCAKCEDSDIILCEFVITSKMKENDQFLNFMLAILQLHLTVSYTLQKNL